MRILGIETSADETAASIIKIQSDKVNVLSNVISSQIELHTQYGGIVPSLAAREHVRNLPPVLNAALEKANTKMQDIDLIAVTSGPGLISSLLVGTAYAKTLAWHYRKPIIGTYHIEGHTYSNWLNLPSLNENIFPALCLIVSGGHTELVLMRDYGSYELIGRTRDDASGEAFDKIARIIELGYPGGPAISKLAEKHDPNNSSVAIKLPRPMLHSGDFNFSFSGLKTAVLYFVRDNKSKYDFEELQKAVAYEAEQAITETLVTKTIKAAKEYGVNTILIAGGVSANKVLRNLLKKRARDDGFRYIEPGLTYTTDNATMIALAGYFNYQKLEKENRLQEADWRNINSNANWEII